MTYRSACGSSHISFCKETQCIIACFQQALDECLAHCQCTMHIKVHIYLCMYMHMRREYDTDLYVHLFSYMYIHVLLQQINKSGPGADFLPTTNLMQLGDYWCSHMAWGDSYVIPNMYMCIIVPYNPRPLHDCCCMWHKGVGKCFALGGPQFL